MELLDTIIVHFFGGAAVFLVGIAFGWFLREQHAIRRVNEMFAQLEDTVVKQEEGNNVKGTIEIHHGHYYMFHSENGSFLAQGGTKKELSEALRARFPDKTFILANEQYEDLGFKNDAI